MEIELFDLVDEHDTVVGTTNKETAHRDGQIHRAVAVFVFTKDGRLYLQEHISDGLLDNSIGGHVKKDESYDEAVKREAKEELNIICPLAKVDVFYSDERRQGNTKRHWVTLYECAQPDDWHFQETEEVKKIIPMTFPEIISLVEENPYKFTGAFINILRKYIKNKNLPYTLKDWHSLHSTIHISPNTP